MLNVLVVDDDEEFRVELAEALSSEARVTAVATPVEALWQMERTPIDILICDMILATSSSGADVLEAVRAQWPQVGRILVTGYGDHVQRLAGVAAHAVLLKPCDLGELRAQMARLIGGADNPAAHAADLAE